MKFKFGCKMVDISKIMSIKKMEHDSLTGTTKRTRYYVVLYMKGGDIYDEGFYTEQHRNDLYDRFYQAWKRYKETFKGE